MKLPASITLIPVSGMRTSPGLSMRRSVRGIGRGVTCRTFSSAYPGRTYRSGSARATGGIAMAKQAADRDAHDQWFREEVESGIREAADPPGRRIQNERARERWTLPRAELAPRSTVKKTEAR